jgi:hypothetical protein
MFYNDSDEITAIDFFDSDNPAKDEFAHQDF